MTWWRHVQDSHGTGCQTTEGAGESFLETCYLSCVSKHKWVLTLPAIKMHVPNRDCSSILGPVRGRYVEQSHTGWPTIVDMSHEGNLTFVLSPWGLCVVCYFSWWVHDLAVDLKYCYFKVLKWGTTWFRFIFKIDRISNFWTQDNALMTRLDIFTALLLCQ